MSYLSQIANYLPRGRIRGNVVDFVPPSASHQHKRWKRRRRTASVFLNGDEIYVYCRHPDDSESDAIRIKDELKKHLGIEWKPKPKRRQLPKRAAAFRV